jgi:uncharacterized protein YndB with AHSA1/START domain
MAVRREIEIEASPDEVWEALIDEERREDWLGEGEGSGEGSGEGLGEGERTIEIEEADPPHRLVWWWSSDGAGGGEGPTRVEISIVAVPAGARVIVTESVPSFPLPALAAAVALVAV